MRKGDLVLIPFPFTDLSGIKNRPAVVLFEDDLDVTVSFISTQLKWKTANDLLIRPSEENGLKMDSIIRISKVATLDKSMVIGRLGRIGTEQISQLNNILISLFDLQLSQ